MVWFLWITIAVEILGSYAPIGYFTDYKYFASVRDTLYMNNFWIYNIFIVINFSFFTYYFISLLNDKILRWIFWVILVIFLGVSSWTLAIDDNLFEPASRSISIFGTLMLLLAVLSFYYELLRSDMLLHLKYFLPFYVSVGILVSSLSMAPIDIFSDYFSVSQGNELFVALHLKVVFFANIFLYLSFTIGFLICSRRMKYYY